MKKWVPLTTIKMIRGALKKGGWLKSPHQSQWPSGQCVRLLCGRSPNQMLASYLCHMHVEMWSAAMLATKRSAGVTPEVNLRNSLHAGDKACKRGIRPVFETQGRHHQKFKTRVSVAPQKGLMSSKFIFKKMMTSKNLRLSDQVRENIQTWMGEVPGSIFTWVTICCWNFFS